MPALRTKQYGIVSTAAATSVRPGPAVPNRRYLMIQNTGANPGLFRFGGSTRGDGSDMLFAAGTGVILSTESVCPIEDLNFSSVLGTTWSVIEGVES